MDECVTVTVRVNGQDFAKKFSLDLVEDERFGELVRRGIVNTVCEFRPFAGHIQNGHPPPV